MTGRVDPLFLSLAYSFVGLRVAHSLYHIFVNGFIGPLPIRALLCTKLGHYCLDVGQISVFDIGIRGGVTWNLNLLITKTRASS